jgi:hypothetical protein
MTSLTRPLQANDLGRLGPVFAFVLWVAARSLVIMWATGSTNVHAPSDDDMKTLMSALQLSALRWPCAKRFFDLLQLALDNEGSPGGPQNLDIFIDTRRTAYGLEKRLGGLASRQLPDLFAQPWDFLDLPFPEDGNLATHWIPDLGLGTIREWL